MKSISPDAIRELLVEYGAGDRPDRVILQIELYLATFAIWSKRMSLSTIREPAEVVQRHFGEGFALAKILPHATHLLDLGSGAGFPGIPIALAKPDMRVTLAEVQVKKASFLREVTAQMDLGVEVWSRRAEDLCGVRSFDVVALRAVDNMQTALGTAVNLLRPGGTLAFFVSPHQEAELPERNWLSVQKVSLPGCSGGAVLAKLA